MWQPTDGADTNSANRRDDSVLKTDKLSNVLAASEHALPLVVWGIELWTSLFSDQACSLLFVIIF